jgi:hypothetical protein
MSLIKHNDFLGKMIYKMNKNISVLLTFQVPMNLFLRAEILCEDIEELAEMHFSQNILMNLLYNDFLLYAKKNPNPQAYFNLLCSLERSSGKEKQIHQEKNVFTFVHKEVPQENKTMQIKMKRKVALRGEVLLADMEEVQSDHGYTLERIFELLYIDFIDTFRK